MLAIPPDFSFLVQIVSFFILWMGLKRLIWDPMLAVLEQREARTTGARHAAEEFRAAADSSAAEYEQRLQAARVGISGELQTVRVSIEADERRILNEARDQAAAQLTQLRDNLTRQANAAQAEIATGAQGLAKEMVQRVVGRSLA